MTAYLAVTGFVFLIVGLRALLQPVVAVAEPYSLAAETVDAKHYLRSGAGGVTLACAAVLLAGAFISDLTFTATVLAVTILGGLVLGRLFSVAVDGSPGPTPWVSGGVELLGLVSGLYWLLFS